MEMPSATAPAAQGAANLLAVAPGDHHVRLHQRSRPISPLQRLPPLRDQVHRRTGPQSGPQCNQRRHGESALTPCRGSKQKMAGAMRILKGQKMLPLPKPERPFCRLTSMEMPSATAPAAQGALPTAPRPQPLHGHTQRGCAYRRMRLKVPPILGVGLRGLNGCSTSLWQRLCGRSGLLHRGRPARAMQNHAQNLPHIFLR
jgi:hypothetical protein